MKHTSSKSDESTDRPFFYVLTVSELTQDIRDLLEERFPDLWVEGEISNLRIPPSGHVYFTLKDDSSQIRAVIFKTQARRLRFVPKDGLQILCRGRVSLYEKRGEYQLILESMEPKGIGALQLAFLQLKERLQKEGLFDADRKRPIPTLPQKIGIVTSPTGAVIQDMLRIIERRFENVHLLLYPVRVQGEGASSEIAQAITYFSDESDVDVMIVGRGGGSLEDLWSFNEEPVARAIYRSKIPVISAVGHETDYTIADFVADVRAPTPSAAAELVVKDKRELIHTLYHLVTRLENQIEESLQNWRTHLFHLRKRLGDPSKRLESCVLRADELENRLHTLILWNVQRKREAFSHHQKTLFLQRPRQKIEKMRLSVSQIRRDLEQNLRHSLAMKRGTVKGLMGKLDSLSPLAILQRGYSITRKLPSLRIVRRVSQVKQGDQVEVRLFQGTLVCDIDRTENS
jgi:exodeoxyribonuclease VII large subunit